MVELDGGEGEGGGQILRTALSLSLITGQPFRIRRIRANRSPPGLRPQHLACVRGAEALSGGSASGAEVGASELTFEPRPVKAGDYLLEVGSAGSTPLLFQCLFFPLALAGGGQLTLRGGTHVSHSPSYHYLAWVWQPAMRAYGLGAELKLHHAGFYPEGGGEFRASIPKPGVAPNLVELPARGTLRDIDVMSFVGGLSFEIAERQARAAVAALREKGVYSNAENFPLPVTRSAGTMVFIRAEFEHTIAGFTALGEKGKPAEEVGREAAGEVSRFLESPGALEEHLADQILIPAALLAAGRLGDSAPAITRFAPAVISSHLTTNAQVLEQFLPLVRIEIGPHPSVTVRSK